MLPGTGRKRRFLLFGIVNVLITNFLLQLALLLMPIPLATLLSQTVNVSLGFVLYGRYVFRVQRLRKRSAWRYLLLAVLMWWTNWLGIELFAGLGVTQNFAAALMVPFLAALSYLAQKRVVFSLGKS